MPEATSPEPPPIDGHWVESGLRMQVLVPPGLALVLLVTSFVVVLVLARMNRSEAEVARAATAGDVMLQERTSGGTLTADSDGPGKGAIFTLYLPIAVTQAA